MKTLIIYGSQYGSTKRYAERLSKNTGLPESQRTADAKAMLETYGQDVDYVDFSALEQITSQL